MWLFVLVKIRGATALYAEAFDSAIGTLLVSSAIAD